MRLSYRNGPVFLRCCTAQSRTPYRPRAQSHRNLPTKNPEERNFSGPAPYSDARRKVFSGLGRRTQQSTDRGATVRRRVNTRGCQSASRRGREGPAWPRPDHHPRPLPLTLDACALNPEFSRKPLGTCPPSAASSSRAPIPSASWPEPRNSSPQSEEDSLLAVLAPSVLAEYLTTAVSPVRTLFPLFSARNG